MCIFNHSWLMPALSMIVLCSSIDEAHSQQGLSFTIDSPNSNDCVPNNPTIQPGGSPDEPGIFQPSSVPFTFTVIEPNGDDVTLSATVDGQPVSLTNNTVFTNGAGISTTIDYFAIEGNQVIDQQGLTLVVTAQSPAGSISDAVTFDLDRTPPSIEFSIADLELLNSCQANATQLMSSINPTVLDDNDPSPIITTEDILESCALTRVFTVSDHCGEGNSQEVYFQINKPSVQPAEFVFSGAESEEVYLETYSYFSVTDSSCFEVVGQMTIDGAAPSDVTTGTYLDTPGSYHLDVTATDCAGTTYESSILFDLLEKPFASTGGPYQGVQGQVVSLDGGESFCPPELGGILEYAWDFDLFDDSDGGYIHVGEVVDFVNRNGNPLNDGTYTVGLRITTQAGQVEYDNTEVVIADAPPVCDAGGPYEVEQGIFLTFDGSNSSAGTPSEPILAYRWHFGEFPGELNEQFSPNLTRPEHFYLDEGEYTVTLNAYDIDSECTAQATVNVLDVEPVVRDLSVLGDPPYMEGSLLTFSAGTTTAGSPAEPIIQFIWDWGDMTPNTQSLIGEELRRPSHYFNDSGLFNVCLSVDDSDSLVTGCLPVEINDLRPIARLTGDLFTIEGNEASFSLAGTRAGGEADPLSFALIDWGDGSDIQRIDDFSITDLTHRFEADGELVIIMSLFDEEETDPVIIELDIYVDDVSPTPVVSSPLLIEEGLEATWSAAESTPGASSDPIVSYRWDWGDGSPIQEDANSVRSHTYGDDGTYQLRLTVIDSDGSLSTISRFINVNNRAPFNAVINTDSPTVDFGEPIRFEVTYEDVPTDFVSISWRMGEGSTYSNQRIINHSYRELGIFTVRATLTDEDGGETVVSYDLEVSPAGPRIVIPEIEPISEGDLLSFDIELRAAETESNVLDGPVELRILRSPLGLEAIPLESANPTLSNRFRFEWLTNAQSAGEYTLKILGVSPAGVTRIAERRIIVRDTQDYTLATLGGSINGAALSLFKYQTDLSRELTELNRLAHIDLGRGVGQLISVRNEYFVTVPVTGVVAVVSEPEAKLLRKVPIAGEPYAITEALDLIWVFDARRSLISAIDRRLKVSRRSTIDQLNARVIAAKTVSISGEERILILCANQEILVLNPEAYISNQPSRAVLTRINLSSIFNPVSAGDTSSDSSPVSGGLLLTDSDHLIAYTAQGVVAFTMNELESTNPNPSWIIRSASPIRSMIDHKESLWSVSNQGLRRFDWPEDGFGLNEPTILEGTILDLNQQSTLASLPHTLMGESVIITANSRQVIHLSSESMRQVLVTPDLNPQHILITERETRD